jgi:MSHA pilin protein MshC
MTDLQKKANFLIKGFTMIELIVVIIIIAIMATTVIPKFFNSTGFQEYTFQAEAITKLRAIQLRAMQDTNINKCYTVLVTEDALGVPNDCDLTLAKGWQGENTSTGEPGTTKLEVETQHNVVLSPVNFDFTFDNLGRPSCSNCLITIKGESTLHIKIESEGYIHEG